MLIMFISMNICLLKMYMTGSMFIKFGKCTKSVPLPNCDEMHHLLTCYASPQVKTAEAFLSISSNESRTIRDCGNLMPKRHAEAIHFAFCGQCVALARRAGRTRKNRTCSIFCESSQSACISRAARIVFAFKEDLRQRPYSHLDQKGCIRKSFSQKNMK